jgi:hypothetical protein
MTTHNQTTPVATRSHFQGVWNIVRFNYEFFVLSFLVVVGAFCVAQATNTVLLQVFSYLVSAGAFIATLVSLGVSWYVYDYSPLHTFHWLDSLIPQTTGNALNIHAGFDETSELLLARYPRFSLDVIDFYDPLHHTERSIKRARRAQPPFPGTRSASATDLRLPAQHYQVVFLLLAVHEIRSRDERIAFLNQLKVALTDNGVVIVVEHARDLANFCAYSIGFFHFLPVRELCEDFATAGLQIKNRSRITPFVRVYSLATL